MQTDYQRVRDAIVYIDKNSSDQPTLEDVAEHIGLSPYHFQRLFRRWAGISPKRFLQHVTAANAKRLLRDSTPVLDAAFAVGLSSPGRLHDLIVTTEAVTPGEYKSHGEGITIHYGIHETPYGPCLIGATERGICALRFLNEANAQEAVVEIQAEWSRATLLLDQDGTTALVHLIFEEVESSSDPLPLLLKGSNFQLKVWEGLLRVPEGCVVSYGDLAERLSVPSAARAVANAVGANPIAYVIPCHRVLRSTGALGGYRWGTDRKLVILERELMTGGIL